MARYKLKLTSLKFISPVDTPAQGTATALLLKRAGTSSAVARVAKVDDELGLVFCWAFTSKAAGETYYDLHGDAIEGDFVKVCAEFMEGARAVDEMHDGKATGQVVFGMPMTAEIAKAFGVETDTEGFMVAIKPAPAAFEKFKDGTYTGVSIEGMGVREEVSARKRAALTTAMAGHTHMLLGVDEMQAGSTSTEAMPGTEHGYHSHPWVKGEDGAIAIGEQHGHTHEVATTSSSEKRAPVPAVAGNSTAAQPAAKVASDTKEPAPMDIATLKKNLSLALALPEAQRAHAATLAEADLDAFLAKSAGDRESIVKAALEADPVLYTRTDGTTIRKSQGQLLADIAKQADEATRALAAEVVKREQVELLKRADVELSHFAKTAGVRAAVLKAIDGIPDEATRKDALEMLAGANAALKELGKPQGANPEQSAEGTSKQAALRTAVEAIAKAKGIAYPLALIEALKTDPAIRDLYEQADAERN